MQTKKIIKSDTRYVITKDGLRMSYKEYIDMIENERN